MALSPRMKAMVQPSVADLDPYDPAFIPCEVNLSANENTWPQDAALTAEIARALAETPLNRYPDPMANGLRDRIARIWGVRPDQVVVGNGGDELIFDLLLAFGGPGRTVVTCPPTFEVYRIYGSMVGSQVVEVPRREDFSLDVDALLAAAATADLVCLTSPNNPTGDLVEKDLVARLAALCPGIVLVDEAYGEFAPEGSSALDLVVEGGNVVILHTLSKAHAMAGVRLGYLLAPSDVVEVLSAVRQPYSVGVLPQAAAAVALDHRGAMEAQVAAMVAERGRLAEALGAMEGIEVFPSAANFLLVRMDRAHDVRQALALDHSILVRDFTYAPGLAGCLRVSVGTPEEDDRLIAALEAVRESMDKEGGR